MVFVDPDTGMRFYSASLWDGLAQALGLQTEHSLYLSVVGQPTEDNSFELPVQVLVGTQKDGRMVYFSWAGKVQPQTAKKTEELVELFLEHESPSGDMPVM